MLRGFFVAMLLPLLVAGCSPRKTGIAGASCNASADCDAELQCMQNVCREIAADHVGQTPQPSLTRQETEKRALLAIITTLRQKMLKTRKTSDRVSHRECNGFAKKVVELTVQSQSGTAAEMTRTVIEGSVPQMERDCYSKGTKQEISCALRAGSLEELELCEGSKQASADRPSQLSCEAFADKIIELAVLAQPDGAARRTWTIVSETRPAIINDCIEMGTEAVLNCTIRARSLDALEQCG